MSLILSRRAALGAATASIAMGLARPHIARAATKLRFLTSWFAQAEHGGFYQALATGLYAKEGLDVSIDMGGPQVNGLQLLTGGAADIVMGYDIQVLKAVEKKLPVVTVAASFQYDLQGVMTHPDINSIADLKGHRILIASTSYATFWPWLKQRFGFTDDQAGPYTFNLQPFLVDPKLAVQGYGTSEPFEAKEMGADVKFFLFADSGYPPYGSPMVTTTRLATQQPEVVRGFVRASLLGWRDYLRNPAPGNALIKQANPKMDDARIAFAIAQLKALHALDGGDAKTGGIGVMTAARWQQTRDFLVTGKILSPVADWHAAFTTKFVDGLNIMPDSA